MAKKAMQLGQVGEGFDDVMGVLVSNKERSCKILKAEYGSPDKPLKIGDHEIPCYVLEDGTRVITGRGIQNAVGFPRESGGNDLYKFLYSKKLINITNKYLPQEKFTGIEFEIEGMGRENVQNPKGYEATIIVDIAKAIIEANNQRLLTPKQSTYAIAAQILINSLGKVGIIGLVDEATGYQEIRAKDALQGLLDLYVKSELGEWMKRFPDEYYKQIFKLRGWEYTEAGIKKRPGVIGHWTKDIVYSRIAPGLLEELEKKNPKNDKGNRRNRHHQYLTEDIGHPELAKHIHMVIALMRATDSWDDFYSMLNKSLPKKIDAKQFLLGFEEFED